MSIQYLLAIIFFSSLFSFLVTLFISPIFIKYISKYNLCKNIRTNDATWAVASVFRSLHLKKQWTPTMWWVIIWGSVLFVILFTRILAYYWFVDESLLDRGEVYLPLFTLFTMWILGLIDDYLNIIESKNKWLAVHPKMFFILLFATIWACWFYFKLWYASIYIPFLWDTDIGVWYIPLFIFIITSCSHAVNITDWLDWLAWWLLVIAFVSFGWIAFYKWLFTLTTFCAVVVWSITAFLWNNVPPAKFYMWDTWSLALWATLWVISMMIDSVFALPIIWAIFIFETISVIIQVTSKKLRNWKKVFKVAPIHHHFEAIGWWESQVVMRFWIIGGFLGMVWLIVGIMNS